MKRILALGAVSLFAACGNMSTPVTKPTDKPFVSIPVSDGAQADTQRGTVIPGSASENNLPTETKYCKKDETGGYNFGVPTVHGGGDDDNYWWGEGGGCLNAPVERVWLSMQKEEVFRWADVGDHYLLDPRPIEHPEQYPKLTKNGKKKDRIRIPLKAGTRFSPKTDGKLTLYGEYRAGPFNSVWWDVDWFHSVMKGTPSQPLAILINYQKTEGTGYIPIMRGSVLLEKLGDDVTSFTMHNEVNAHGQHEGIGAIKDLFHQVAADLQHYPNLTSNP